MQRFCIFAVLFLLIGGAFSVYAQDLIILKDGNTIEAKVMEISPTEIKYKRFDHLDGPTIVILAVNVLSIRYENGRTEIINAVTQPATTIPTPSVSQPATTIPSFLTQPATAQQANQLDRNPRFNTLGLTLGYLGVSRFGFSLNGTVSPARYTFFDFNVGLGFSSFSFNGNVNFNGFVPFRIGGWYGGLGLGGGVYEFVGSMNGYFSVNAVTGFIFFDWLNVSATLQMELVPEFDIRFKPMVGYAYRFNPRENTASNISDNNSTVPITNPSFRNYSVENVIGNVKMQSGGKWVNVKVGDILANNTVVMIDSYSSLTLITFNGSKTTTIKTIKSGRGFLEIMF